MPDYLKGLVVILALSTMTFMAARAQACSIAIGPVDFVRRRNAWFALVLIAFLAHNFWLYMIAAAIVLHVVQRAEQNKFALYFFLLLAVPAISRELPTLGVLSALFEIDYVRLLALTVLLPAYLSLRKRPGTEPFGTLTTDKLLATYLILIFALTLYYSNITIALRKGVFYGFIDAFLPYYVASRALRSQQQFRDVLMSFLVAALVLSPMLVFEYIKTWLLYSTLDTALGVHWGWNNFVLRGGSLRATGTAGHPIVAGYVCAVALTFLLYFRTLVRRRIVWWLALLVLLGGLAAPLSRGPWLGAAAMFAIFLATGPKPVLAFFRLGMLGVIAIPLLLVSPAGPVILDYLPWIGTVESQNVEGRERLASVSIALMMDNPFLGSNNFLETPEMEALRGPEGIIDLVNTYVIVGLSSGLIGLSLFAGFFFVAVVRIYTAMRVLADKSDERYVLGQTLLSALIGILFIIGTVAPVLFVVPIYWSVAGLGVGYALYARGGSRVTQSASRNTDAFTGRATGPARAR